MHATVRSILTAQPKSANAVTITDMEAGVEVLSRGTPRASDVLLVIAEPYFKSLETAGRVKTMAQELGIPHVYAVSNKVRTDTERRAIEAFCAKQSIEIIAEIPYDDKFVEAAFIPQSPIDFDAGMPGVQAVMGLAQALAQRHLTSV
jgi:CO dehydrogenase maturation factor